MNAINNEKRVLEDEIEPQLLESEPVLAGHEEERTASAGVKIERKSVFDKWSEKLKDFLDNAE
jgi:cell division protein FtsA